MPLLPLFPRVVHRGLPLHRAGIFLPGILTRPRRHQTVRIVGVHRRGVARVLRQMRPPLRCGVGRGSIVAVVTAVAWGRPPHQLTTIVNEAIAPVVRMVRTPFLDLPKHHPRELDPGPHSCDVNCAVRLVDLYSAERLALQVVHRHASRADDSADVCPLAGGRVGLDDRGLFAVVPGGYWHHATFHVAMIVGWDNDDDDDAIAARCHSR
jgi:hypothetical protein